MGARFLCLQGDHAGAVIVGARKILIAYNINLSTTDLDIAKSIAKRIRERLGAEIVEKQKKNPKYQPSLKIIQGTPMGSSTTLPIHFG